MLKNSVYFLAATILFVLGSIGLIDYNEPYGPQLPPLGAASIESDVGATNNESNIYVVRDGESIQSAIDQAAAGDTVVIESNETFIEPLIISKSITLSAGENFHPTLKAPPRRKFTIPGIRDRSIVVTLDGLTIEGSDITYAAENTVFFNGALLRIVNNPEAINTEVIIKNSTVPEAFAITVSSARRVSVVQPVIQVRIIDSNLKALLTAAG